MNHLKSNVVISILIAIFIALVVFTLWAFGGTLFSAFIAFVQPPEAPFIWWKGSLLILLAGVYGFFAEKAESKNIFFDSALFLLVCVFLGVIATRFFELDLMIVPAILTLVLTFLALRVRKLREIELEFVKGLNQLTLAGDLLESQNGDLRIESGLKLLKTVLPLSDVIVFRSEPNGELNPVGRSRNASGNEILSSRHISWRKNVELCENALNQRETIIQRDENNKESAKVALPLISENKVVGGLFVDISQNFERNDQYLLEAFSEQLARNFQRREMRSRSVSNTFWPFSARTIKSRLDMISLINGIIKEQSFGSVATSYLKEAHAIAYLDGTIAYINKRMRSLAEMRPEDIYDIDLFSLLDKFKTDVFNEPSIAIRRVLQTGNEYRCELKFPDSKKTLDLQIMLVKVADDNLGIHDTNIPKKPACFLITFRDITSAKENEKLRSDVVHLMSHELRTPITSIQGFADMLMLDESIPEESREYLSIISKESQRASNLLSNFLSVANLQQKDKQELITSPVKMDAVVSDVVEDLQGVAKQKRIRLVEKPDSFVPPVAADRSLITKAVTHLVDNAVKYSPERSSVIISTILDQDFLRVEVEDRGYGIAPHEQDKIWQKFYRVTRKGQDKEEDSTGLGLSLVKEIIEQHKGNISLESEVGRGSKFSIRIPRL